ncbi:hypothetical protein [Magnetospira sp. QH-2]|uniref:hypothetical protein n=1 Tax=Magnetospira sp. (strain QH-2) TaxID=1288970 RepID=UPI0003E81AE3|nr:hypothetical protein [Magnetospira sp. QH-2]CCQ73063.1 protein of unknown function [Magnetospira sp. QH-2]
MPVTGDTLYIPDPHLGFTIAANASARIQREVSRESVHTDSLGLRTTAPGQERATAQVAAIGCSWTEGVGCDYEESIVGQLEKLLDRPVANLGVGSYSLLQSVMRLEHLADRIAAKDVIVLYGSWLLNRSLLDRKDTIIYRPILATVAGNLSVVPPSNPPRWLIEIYRSLEKTGEGPGWKRTLMAKLRGLAQRLRADTDAEATWLNAAAAPDRATALAYLVGRLASLAKSRGFRVTVFHLYEYERELREGRSVQLIDNMILSKVADLHPEVRFIDDSGMRHRITTFFRGRGTTVEDSLATIHWPDNNHPNATGCELIAQEIAAHF